MGARPAGARRPGGRRGEQGDPGADHPGPRDLRRRDPAAAGPGPKARKKYLQVACTSLLTYYFLGGRDLPSFRDFVYSDLHGTVVVHDRYVNYDAFDGISHQLCTQHLLRDLEDAAQTYPEAIWPGQIAEALRGLIHAANLARDQGLAAVPAEMTAEHLTLFRRGVTVGLSQVRRVPGAKSKQPPARTLLECLRHREADVLRFLTDTAIPPDQQPGRTRPAALQDPAVLMGCAPPSRREKWWCAARDVVILVVLTRPSSSLTLGAVFKGPFIALRARGSDSSEPRLPGRRLRAGSCLGGRGWTR